MTKRITIITLSLLAFYYLAYGVAIYTLQDGFVYHPDRQDFDNCPGFAEAEKINVNGTRAYFKNNSDKIIIFYHGNAGSACQRAYLGKKFEKLGYSYIFPEYAGYSADSRQPSKQLIFDDVDHINDFLKQRPFKQVLVAGESLGCAMAAYHASTDRDARLLLISPFKSLAGIAKISYPIYPVSLMIHDRYDNGEYAPKISDVRIIHGELDEVIPITESRKLFALFGGNKSFIAVPRAHHNDIYIFPEADAAIDSFLK
jgi:pimeloyl-ACP methyl ester carboxylesterase